MWRTPGVSDANGDVVVKFEPGYVHKSDGAPGRDPGTGWLQTVEVRVFDGALDAHLAGLPSGVSDGWVVVGDDRHDNIIPLPFDFRGPVHLCLRLESGAQLSVHGNGIAAVALSDAVYVDEFS